VPLTQTKVAPCHVRAPFLVVQQAPHLADEGVVGQVGLGRVEHQASESLATVDGVVKLVAGRQVRHTSGDGLPDGIAVALVVVRSEERDRGGVRQQVAHAVLPAGLLGREPPAEDHPFPHAQSLGQAGEPGELSG
jgi:hypothetical protein